MHRAEYVPARKGGRHLRDEQGMIYYLSKRRENFCTEKKNLSCQVTAVVENSTEMIIKISGEHVHDSNILHRKVRHLEEQAIKNAADNHYTPRSVLGNLTNTVGNTTHGNALQSKNLDLAKAVNLLINMLSFYNINSSFFYLLLFSYNILRACK